VSMDRDAVLERMRAYFERKQPPEVLATFGTQSPKALLPDSLDVVDFILYLEEATGCEIDVNEVGESLMNKNFDELAAEVSHRLAER
jgi:acyl carrier protein